MASIGDLFLRVLAEMDGFETQVVKDAQKAGDKAGTAMQQSMGSKLKANAGRALFAGVGIAAGIATKGVLELEEATAAFRAETGATAEEAEAAGKAINDMAGRNIQPLEEVGRTLSTVHTDLGLTGEAAETAAESFLKYGRATGRDAADGVSALDDILDAWNLDSADSVEIMDKLIASHQEYGGSIDDNEKALSNLAPQLQALNLDVDDGIGLLNLFASSGLDASKAQFALNSAITKLPPGESLEQFIARLSTIEDDGERAREAIEVFGARGGAGLANALRPGMGGLDQFKIATEEATGSTEEAADALDSTWGSRFKLLLKGAGAALTGFGAQFGPALTGLASLASLGGAAGGGKLARAMVNLGKGMAGKIAAGLASTGAITALSNGLGTALGKVTSSSKVTAATDKLGGLLGSKLGKGLSLAFAAVAVFEVVETYNRIKGELGAQTEQIGRDVANQLVKGTTDQLQQSKSALEAGIKALGDQWYNPFAGDQKNKLMAELDAVNAELAKRAAGLPGAVADPMEAGQGEVTGAAEDMVDGIPGAVDAAAIEAGEAAAQTPGEIADGIRSRRDEVESAVDQLMTDLENAMSPGKERARIIGHLVGDNLAEGLRSKDPVVRAQAEHTRDILEGRLAELPVTAEGLSKKTGDKIRDGLKSKDPEVRAQAQRTAGIIEKQIENAKTYKAGRKAGQEVADGVNSKRGVVGRAAYNMGRGIVRNLLGGILYQGGGKAAKDDKYVPGKAAGGPVSAGVPYIVGEVGPELFVPTASGTIIPNSALTTVASGGGDTHVHLSTYGLPMRAETPAEVVHRVRRAARLGALTPQRRAPAWRPT